MNKRGGIGLEVLLGGVILLALAVVTTASLAGKNPVGTFDETQARKIAENFCIKGGESMGAGSYNENSRTWWFDANLNSIKEGCNPACVVSEDTKTAEINWRCTGLVAPTGEITNFEQCAAAGNPVAESYPRQCRANGQVFVEIIQTSDAREEITKLFTAKYPKYAAGLAVVINAETATHARGNVSFEPGAPGGIFLAAKVDGKWQLVFDGNGSIPCSLSKYDFPEEMLADCAQ